ncbi:MULTISPECIES: S24 family peptidase [unclassified Marinovum]|uniref:S24 family peptidase n=1 Tax=unclassified Marinovum TaxID=2647166 RepID=UPI003EDC995A
MSADIEKLFAEAVSAKVAELDTNVFAIEKRAGLPADAIRSVIRGDDKRAVPRINRAKEICDVLGLEFYIGPSRDPVGAIQPPSADPAEMAHIPLYNAGLAAGDGANNGEEEIIDYLAFRKDWLRKIGVAPSNALMARVKGESMQPTISSGDMVLIDSSKIEVRSRSRARKVSKPHVYAFVESGEARVKRIDRVDTDYFAVISDNPEFQMEFKSSKALQEMHIIGRVLWWAHTDRG